MKKGLRLPFPIQVGAFKVRTVDLMKKGLRLLERELEAYVGQNRRPDEEGIKAGLSPLAMRRAVRTVDLMKKGLRLKIHINVLREEVKTVDLMKKGLRQGDFTLRVQHNASKP